jgi:hypothetical protein
VKLALPIDCADWSAFEWDEPVTAAPTVAAKPKRSFKDFERSVKQVPILAAPVKYKSLAESVSELVCKVTKRHGGLKPPSSLAIALSGK